MSSQVMEYRIVLSLESAVLSAWYNDRPEIRRLLALRDPEGLRVLVELEPAQDSGEMNAAWTANHQMWTDELQWHTGAAVRLEHLEEADGVQTSGEEVVATLFWRAPAYL